jgi:hypothetical protein
MTEDTPSIMTEGKTIKCPHCSEGFDLEVTVSSDKVGNLRTIGVEYLTSKGEANGE